MSNGFERVEILLCDADGNLFPSEEPAFDASTEVTNRVLAELGIDRSFTSDELRGVAVGKNFRATITDLAAEHGVTLDPDVLEREVLEEKRAVSAHLAEVLQPDPAVLEPLTQLAQRYRLAAVSSSALTRLDACFEATGLAGLFPASERYSAEDSLPAPTSKPDPAIYQLAGARLGVEGERAVAIEDAVAGVRSAVAAGFPCVGNVLFVGPDEREERVAALTDAGAVAVVDSWWELSELLTGAAATA
jgi:beta-phosphoglucomutase-like phosphatase (HAD superfamily)